MSAQSEARLIQAVHAYLDEMAKADEEGDRLGWPEELEALTAWKPKVPLTANGEQIGTARIAGDTIDAEVTDPEWIKRLSPPGDWSIG